MCHPPKSPDGEEWGGIVDTSSGPYSGRGWDVTECQIGHMGTMRNIAREIFAPADCVVVETNARLKADRDLVNTAAEGDGWLVRLELKGPGPELMAEAAYAKFCAEEAAEEPE